MPHLLAIDTCTRLCSLALRDEHALRAERTWLVERHHTASISAHIQQMCADCGIAPAQLSAVAVATGPGSFTGVRCGLSIAKGLALATDARLIGICAFDILRAAQPILPDSAQLLYVLIEAGRKRVAVKRYDGSVTEPNRFVVQSWDEFEATVKDPATVCGDVPTTLEPRLLLRIAAPALNVRRAGVLADLAFTRFEQGAFDSIDTLAPIYPPQP